MTFTSLLALAGIAAATRAPAFRAHLIDEPEGKDFGQTSLVDLDHDGDLDFVSGAKGANIYWFEYQSADRWVRHLVGAPARTDVGGVALDVDRDGWLDLVSGGDWYRNPAPPRAAPFEKHATGIVKGHDNLAADLDGDGRPEVIALSNDGVWWYRIGKDPTQPWESHQLLGKESPQVHGGLAVGDVDGDGDMDVTRVDVWMENVDGKGGTWRRHQAFDFGRAGPFGVQTRARLVDLDGDKDLDLVQTEGDIVGGRVAWFENADGHGGAWTRHLLLDGGHDQDLHSLAIADFDGDGHPDLFTCGGPLTRGTPRWMLWRNTDGRGRAFVESDIHSGVECHEAVAGDVDHDGDIDIVSKPWNGRKHVYLENLRR